MGSGVLTASATDSAASASAFPAKVGKKGWQGYARYVLARMRRLFGSDIPENAAEAREAVTHFLSEMESVAARTYPAWSKILNDALSECALGYDDRRTLFEIHPIDDYYFAGVVALEAARLRSLYSAPEAEELLSEIGEQIDAKVGRQDRVVSDLLFKLIGRIDLGAGIDKMKTPYDVVVKTLLQEIGVSQIENTRLLMSDVGFRHMLGEPLAMSVPQWWKAFQTRFTIYWTPPEDTEIDDQAYQPTAPVSAPLRRRPRRRAVAF